ncbi:Protein-arginine kinase [bacterium HR15]|nr:Protein-arginine kinase [bacterium HR15]
MELGWLKEPAPYRDVVISQRVRLARNLLLFPFPHAASEAQLREVAQLLRAVLEPIGLGTGGVKELAQLSLDERAQLAGARVISPALLPALPHRWVLLSEDGSVVALINEEDHLRLQITHAGWQPDRMVDELHHWEQRLDALPMRWGYSSRLGYLTASPINLGSGIRLGLLMHLMGLQRARQITRWLEALQALGCHTRGLYGEGSLAFEGYVQISLLGRRDPLPELLARLRGTLRTLIEAELEARLQLSMDELDAEWEELNTTLRHAASLSLGTTLRTLAVHRMRAMLRGDEAQRDFTDQLLFGLAVYPPPEPDYAASERARWLRENYTLTMKHTE